MLTDLTPFMMPARVIAAWLLMISAALGIGGGTLLTLIRTATAPKDFSGQTLTGQSFSGQKLRRADFSNVTALGVNFNDGDYTSAFFVDGNLRNAQFSRANLSSANLSGADLRGATLSDAELSQALFQGADLTEASLFNADLEGVDLTGVTSFLNTNFADADLEQTQMPFELLCDAQSFEDALLSSEVQLYIEETCPTLITGEIIPDEVEQEVEVIPLPSNEGGQKEGESDQEVPATGTVEKRSLEDMW